MKHQLNPNVETFLLISTPNWGKEQKKKLIEELDEYGVNGAAFYAANCVMIDKFSDAFVSRMVQTEGIEIFNDMTNDAAFYYIYLLLLHPEWLDDLDAVPEEDVHDVVQEMVKAFLETEGDIVGALETSGFSDQVKWQVAALVQQPKQRAKQVFDAVKANLPAFEYAYAKFEPEIAPLLEQFDEQMEKGDMAVIAHQVTSFNPETQIIPCLTMALGIIGFDEFCILGLLMNKAFAGQVEGLSKTEVLLTTKAISDTSRLEILLALKEKEMYNLEIARMLNLTPATTSHHMNNLLSAGLVEVTIKDGKAYYSLCEKHLKRYQEWFNDTLL